jgi:DegV family protein with EDD domain
MKDYAIITDSGCDLSQEMVENLGIGVAPMGFTLAEKAYRHFHDFREMSKEKFYSMIRKGETGKTNGANIQDIIDTMREKLKAGMDILFLSFSSGMSCSYQNACIAARELKEEYPDSDIQVVDTKTGSVGLGLLTFLAAQRKAAGEKMSELIGWIETHKLNIHHFFVVDDLGFIQRSGRTSHLAAFVGTILGVKPIFKLDQQGKVDSDAKVRGKKAAIKHMIDQAKKKCTDVKTFFICHGDVDDEAEDLKQKIHNEFPESEVVVNCVGPILGTNVGPGAIALIFYGDEQER